jgi:hypothetical protein
MLEKGQDLTSPPSLDGTDTIKDKLVTALSELKRDWEKREAKLELARLEQQAASRLAIIDFRIKRIRDRLAKLQAGRGDERVERVVRMISSQLAKAEQEKEGFLASNRDQSWGAIEHEEIAVGFLEVPKSSAAIHQKTHPFGH